MNIFRLFWNMLLYMIGWGVLGGAGLGAVYGIIIAFTVLLDVQRGLNANVLFYILTLSLAVGAPFGAIFGAIVGFILGIVNGFSAGVLTRMIFSLSRNWGWYRLCIGLASAGFALAGGVLVFSVFMNPYSVGDFILSAGIPALIAAAVFGHASQRAARRHLKAVTASRPYVPVV